jgi:hypothetical protein
VRLAVVRGEHVVAEVTAGAAQHGVRVVAVVGGVVLDQQVITLHPVIVPCARGNRSFPGEVQLGAGEPVGFPGREPGGQPAEVERDQLAEHRARARAEAGSGHAQRFDAFLDLGTGPGADIAGRLRGDHGDGAFRGPHRVKQHPGQVLFRG